MMSRCDVVLLLVSLFVDSTLCQNESSQLVKRGNCPPLGATCTDKCCGDLVCISQFDGESKCFPAAGCATIGNTCNDNCCKGLSCLQDNHRRVCMHRPTCVQAGVACYSNCCEGLVCNTDRDSAGRCWLPFQCFPGEARYICREPNGSNKNMTPWSLLAVLVVVVWTLNWE